MATHTLSVQVVQGNAKRIDPDILKKDGIGKAWVKLIVGNQEHKTSEKAGLDPVWEEEYQFQITDPETDKLVVQFYLGSVQIGFDGVFVLDGLKQKQSTYKGLAVPGGKVDFNLRAEDFGKLAEEEGADGDDDWMSFV
jgi:hypothetical protein